MHAEAKAERRSKQTHTELVNIVKNRNLWVMARQTAESSESFQKKEEAFRPEENQNQAPHSSQIHNLFIAMSKPDANANLQILIQGLDTPGTHRV